MLQNNNESVSINTIWWECLDFFQYHMSCGAEDGPQYKIEEYRSRTKLVVFHFPVFVLLALCLVYRKQNRINNSCLFLTCPFVLWCGLFINMTFYVPEIQKIAYSLADSILISPVYLYWFLVKSFALLGGAHCSHFSLSETLSALPVSSYWTTSAFLFSLCLVSVHIFSMTTIHVHWKINSGWSKYFILSISVLDISQTNSIYVYIIKITVA
jgi:hypothetical protein